MEAATTLSIPQVQVRGDRLVIDALSVTDPCVVRLAREREAAGERPDRLVVDALEIGARVIDREQTGANADFVRAEFDRAARELEGEFAARARTVTEQLDEKIGQVFAPESGTVSRLLERHFGADSNVAVQNQVKAMLAESATRMREDLARQFTADSDANPLAVFQRAALAMFRQTADQQVEHLRDMTGKLEAVKLEINELRAERERIEQVEAERDRGTAKGRSFEERVVEALDRIALAQGDLCEAVGDVAEGTRKTGDVVVVIDGAAGPGRARIVFEAKHSQLSRNRALEELDRAMEVRAADFGVLVVPDAESVPARTHPLREYNGDKLIVTLDAGDGSTLALELGYALARARALLARGGSDGVDVSAIEDLVERATGGLEETRRIKQTLTSARTQIEKAADLVDSMTTRTREHLAAIAALTAGVSDQ